MEQTYAIELKNITKRFGKIVANDGINLKVKRGEILSLLGENGSGKTTLMNMISGIYFPDEGRILVDGKAVSIRSPKAEQFCGDTPVAAPDSGAGKPKRPAAGPR